MNFTKSNIFEIKTNLEQLCNDEILLKLPGWYCRSKYGGDLIYSIIFYLRRIVIQAAQPKRILSGWSTGDLTLSAYRWLIPRYIKFDSSKNISPDDVLNFEEKEEDNIQQLIDSAHEERLHVILNLHRVLA